MGAPACHQPRHVVRAASHGCQKEALLWAQGVDQGFHPLDTIRVTLLILKHLESGLPLENVLPVLFLKGTGHLSDSCRQRAHSQHFVSGVQTSNPLDCVIHRMHPP